ncbi:efflux RND transporter periplasmic adaptor subunit [Yunchengibacter salinarum]|uniref:efflux RND transporter periplasmic adaptor subunit n=1 Tax=Yunchengibacter salinarum TaxID=3133399 RepID=UPI0035B5F4D7
MTVGRVILIMMALGLAGLGAWLALTGTPGGGGPRWGNDGDGAVTVGVERVSERRFTRVVEALGTTTARESVTLNSTVTDTVAAIHFQDGDLVEKGDLLIELTADEEKAELAEVNAAIAEAERQYTRLNDLVKQGNASPATLDSQGREVAELKSRRDAVKARIADRRVRAPFDGILGLRRVSEGALLTANTPITTIDAIDRVNLDFPVPEKFIATLAPGQTVKAEAEAYPGEVFEGVVKTVSSRVDPATRSVVVRAQLPNPDMKLRPGMLMRLDVESRSWQALAVPEEAVVPSGGREYVYVVRGDSAERVRIELGLRRPGYAEVISGLERGDQVVTEGTLRLGQQGVKVRTLQAEPADGPDSGEASGGAAGGAAR